jgi:hypothetical protein
MYGASVILHDPTAPILGAISGALWEPGAAGGFHKGPEVINFSAQDVGGGVQSVVLTADGSPVGSYNATCNFTFAQPCPSATGPQSLSLSTTELSDGVHTIALVTTDAAGNGSTVASEQVTVANSAPAPPSGLAATPTQLGGSTFTATWADPPGQVAPIVAATYQVCPATGSAPCGPMTSAPPAGPASVMVPGPGTWILSVWLTDAAGNGTAANAAYATLTVPLGEGSRGAGNPGGEGPPDTTATIRVSEHLHGRDLVVQVRGPANGAVGVGFAGRFGTRIVAWGRKTVRLKHGRLSVAFRLGPRTAAHARIRVTARLDHERPVSSTLRR